MPKAFAALTGQALAETSDTAVSKRLSSRAGVIKQLLAHLQRKAESKEFNPLPESSTRRA